MKQPKSHPVRDGAFTVFSKPEDFTMPVEKTVLGFMDAVTEERKEAQENIEEWEKDMEALEEQIKSYIPTHLMTEHAQLQAKIDNATERKPSNRRDYTICKVGRQWGIRHKDQPEVLWGNVPEEQPTIATGPAGDWKDALDKVEDPEFNYGPLDCYVLIVWHAAKGKDISGAALQKISQHWDKHSEEITAQIEQQFFRKFH